MDVGGRWGMGKGEASVENTNTPTMKLPFLINVSVTSGKKIKKNKKLNKIKFE